MISEKELCEIEKRSQKKIDSFKSTGWDGVSQDDFTEAGLMWCIDIPLLIKEIRKLRIDTGQKVLTDLMSNNLQD